jgi:hypothetical protein
MKLVGYGVLQNGIACGIWPRPWDSAMKHINNLREKGSVATFEIVPIFTGSPVAIQPRLVPAIA